MSEKESGPGHPLSLTFVVFGFAQFCSLTHTHLFKRTYIDNRIQCRHYNYKQLTHCERYCYTLHSSACNMGEGNTQIHARIESNNKNGIGAQVTTTNLASPFTSLHFTNKFFPLLDFFYLYLSRMHSQFTCIYVSIVGGWGCVNVCMYGFDASSMRIRLFSIHKMVFMSKKPRKSL